CKKASPVKREWSVRPCYRAVEVCKARRLNHRSPGASATNLDEDGVRLADGLQDLACQLCRGVTCIGEIVFLYRGLLHRNRSQRTDGNEHYRDKQLDEREPAGRAKSGLLAVRPSTLFSQSHCRVNLSW